jgi:hypothetical protein
MLSVPCVRAGQPSPTEASHVREYFYVGGEYLNDTGGHVFRNQMYVEKLSPTKGRTQPYPVVFVHGGGQTGTVRIEIGPGSC